MGIKSYKESLANVDIIQLVTHSLDRLRKRAVQVLIGCINLAPDWLRVRVT